MSKKSVRLSLEVSPELNDALERMANTMHASKSDVLRKSVALIDLALREKNNGNHLGVFNEDQKMVKEIIGY